MPDLRDYDTEKMFRSFADNHSKMVLAPYGGSYFPCAIISRAAHIKDGYLVYFFQNCQEIEIPSTNIFGNLNALVGCEISYNVNGNNGKGIVIASDNGNPPMAFLINCDQEFCAWISFPFIYLNKIQSKVLNSIPLPRVIKAKHSSPNINE